jgi:toxin ParE1/3/4
VPRDELSLGLRALPFKDRCIYFRVMGSRIYIVRILHGRQDISSEDFPESEI